MNVILDFERYMYRKCTEHNMCEAQPHKKQTGEPNGQISLAPDVMNNPRQ